MLDKRKELEKMKLIKTHLGERIEHTKFYYFMK